MHVAAVIKRKGSDVITIAADQTIAEAVNVLTERRIGWADRWVFTRIARKLKSVASPSVRAAR